MYSTKRYLSTFYLKVAILCTKVGLCITACSTYNFKYNVYPTSKHSSDTTNDQGKRPIDNSWLFQVDQNAMTPFCKAIADHDYNKLMDLLKKIETWDPTISDDVIYLITGDQTKNKDDKKYPTRSLLEQVITSSEYELSDYTHTERVLDKLFEILNNYSYDIEKVFSVKHGKDQNNIIHLAVDTANLAIVKRLVALYPKHGDSNNNLYRQMTLCNICNKKGQTPLSLLLRAMSHYSSICPKHEYDTGSEADDHLRDMQIRREETFLYLLKLGASFSQATPSNSASFIGFLLRYYIQHDCANFIVDTMEAISKRKINVTKEKDFIYLTSKDKSSFLLYAVLYRDYTLAEYLLALGACPTWFNDWQVSPILCAAAFRDIEMIKTLSKSKCILDKRCNINQKNKNGLTAQDVAECRNGAEISSALQLYCNHIEKQYGRKIVHNEWNWQPNLEMIELISSLSNDYYGIKPIKKSDLPFHALLESWKNNKVEKTNDSDFRNLNYNASGYIQQTKDQINPAITMNLSQGASIITPWEYGIKPIKKSDLSNYDLFKSWVNPMILNHHTDIVTPSRYVIKRIKKSDLFFSPKKRKKTKASIRNHANVTNSEYNFSGSINQNYSQHSNPLLDSYSIFSTFSSCSSIWGVKMFYRNPRISIFVDYTS